MGFLDSASSLINRGVAQAGRGTKVVSLKAQIADLNRSRTSLCAKLGEALFEVTKGDPAIREPHEALYAAIEEIDTRCELARQELGAVEREMRASASVLAAPGVSSATIACASCGASLSEGALFCPECGAKVRQPEDVVQEDNAQAVRVCPACGAEVGEEEAFCMHCGTSLRAESEES